MKNITLLFLIIFAFGELKSQSTLFLKPNAEEGKDAYLRMLDPNVNRGNHFDFVARAGTNGGIENIIRGIIAFDLSSIPQGSTITNASLSLFSYESSDGGHRLTDGMNDCYLKRVTEPWEEDVVTWENQPSTTELNRVYLPNSEELIQDYKNINVSAILQDMINDPANSHGLIIQQISETIYRTMLFGSSDNTNPDLWPELEITYIEPIASDSCVVFSPDSENGKDAFLRSLDPDENRGTHPDFSAQAGTNGGQLVKNRGIIDFNLKSLPDNIDIVSSILNLYSYDSPANGTHTAYGGGNNEAQLLRVIEPWEESEVTWNNQPAVTESNMQVLKETTNEIQDYSVNTLELVKDYLSDVENSFGFLVKQTEEIPYGRLIFGSSDNTNSSLRPSLEVCYNLLSDIEFIDFDNIFKMYPNPTFGILNVNFEQIIYNHSLVIYAIDGKLLRTDKIQSENTSIDISDLPSGEYVIGILDDLTSQLLVSKTIVKQ